MTRNTKRISNQKPERRISVRSVQRDEPDVRKLAQVLLRLVTAQAEADAQAQHQSLQAVTTNNTVAKKVNADRGRDGR